MDTRKLKILIADDEPDILEIISYNLSAEGYLVITAKNGLILGATIVGAQAGELITTWTLALSRNLNIRAMTGIVVPYPTLSEIGKRAAISYFSPTLNNPRLRRLINFLRRFG